MPCAARATQRGYLDGGQGSKEPHGAQQWMDAAGMDSGGGPAHRPEKPVPLGWNHFVCRSRMAPCRHGQGRQQGPRREGDASLGHTQGGSLVQARLPIAGPRPHLLPAEQSQALPAKTPSKPIPVHGRLVPGPSAQVGRTNGDGDVCRRHLQRQHRHPAAQNAQAPQTRCGHTQDHSRTMSAWYAGKLVPHCFTTPERPPGQGGDPPAKSAHSPRKHRRNTA